MGPTATTTATASSPSKSRDGRWLRHSARRQRTRRALLDAAIAICLEQGPAAVTTTRLASAAGITQPGFYKHFENVEDCLQTMAQDVGAAVRERDRVVRRETDLGSDPRAAIRDIFRRTLDSLLHDRTWLALYLRYRRDPTHALGRAMMENERQGRERLIEDLRVQAESLGLSLGPGAPRLIETYAEILQAQAAGTAEAILDGRADDPRLFVEILTEMTWGMLRGLAAADRETDEETR